MGAGVDICCIGYTRDSSGKVQSRHIQHVSNTIHQSTGAGGNTDCFVLEPVVNQVGNIIACESGTFDNPQRGRVYNPEGLSPSLVTCGGGNREKMIIVQSNPIEKDADVSLPAVLRAERTEFGKSVRMNIEKGKMKMSRHQMTELKPRPDGLTNTLTGVQKDNLLALPNELSPVNEDQEGLCRPLKAQYYKNGKSNFEYTGSYGATGAMEQNGPRFRIRKLTPRECFRLMGVPDANVDLIQQAGISNCQQYKMAGNSIVVDCLEHIFDKLFVHKDNDDAQMSLF